MNKVFLIGNLTRDPELTETAGGVSVCHFAIAVNRSYTSSEGERLTDFFNVTAWRGLADTVARYTKKGSKVAVSGSIQIRNYEDNAGNKRTAVEVVADNVFFVGGKGSGASQMAAPAVSSPAPAAPVTYSSGADSDFEEVETDNDLPF